MKIFIQFISKSCFMIEQGRVENGKLKIES